MTLDSTPRFGVSQFTTWPWSFEQDVTNYSRLGVEAIEVCEFKLDPERIESQLEQLAASGLVVSSVQPALHSFVPDQPRPEPADPRERMRLLRGTIDRFARVAPGTTLVTISGAAPGGDYRTAYEVALCEYRELAFYAGERGVRLALEPLNPILMNVDTFVCSIASAMEIVSAIDQPTFGLFVDVWHIWEDAAADQQILAAGSKIFGVHINDWHRPRHFGDRASIGCGVIDLPRLLRAIASTHYGGAYTLELFSMQWLSDSLWNGDLEELVISNKAAFERLWRQSVCN